MADLQLLIAACTFVVVLIFGIINICIQIIELKK